MELKGKLAIVTGSSKGIGEAVVNALLAKGAWVAGWSRTAGSVKHPQFRHYNTDVRTPMDVEVAFQQTLTDFQLTPSVLINNAGLGYEARLEETSLEQWHDMFDTNVHALFYTTRMVLPVMKKAGQGHIVNISSVAGTTGIPGMSGYCASKYAVRGFTQALFKEVRSFGVKVSCVFPGSVKTNFFDRIGSVEANDQMMHPEDVAATILHTLEAPDNYHVVEVEMRPLKGKG